MPVWRGILDVAIQINPEYQLRCVGVHLKSQRDVPEADQALMRRNEAHLLRAHLDAILDEDPSANILLYGDFNDTRNEMPIRAVQGKFGSDRYFRALSVVDQLGFSWTHHWDDADIYSRIDYIFVSEALSPEINRKGSFVLHHDKWSVASDHRPLVAAIRPEDKD